MSNTTPYCHYYQARIARRLCWFFTAAIRAEEHMTFDRTIDRGSSTFEFFVPPMYEKRFLAFMAAMQTQGVCDELVQLPNRLFKVLEKTSLKKKPKEEATVKL